jgi:hypothetical protein
MANQKIAFRCHHPDCAGKPPTELIIEVPSRSARTNSKKQKPVYCNHNHLNLINLPDTWNVEPLVLGDDDFIGYSEGLPLFQGRRP